MTKSPEASPADDADLAALQDEAAEPSDRVCTPIEQAIRALRPLVVEHGGQLEEVDDDVRSALQQEDENRLQSCTLRLIELTRGLFPGHAAAMEKLQQVDSVPRPLASVAHQVVRDSEAQLDVLRGAVNQLDEQELSGERSGDSILSELVKMVESSHQMRDALDDALLEVARIEDRIDDLPATETTDPATRLPNRAGLEQKLRQWWTQDPERERPLSIGLIDLDHCCELNRQHGAAAADKVIVRLAELISSRIPVEATAVRLLGQQLVVLYPDRELAETASHLEVLRQTIEKSRIDYAGRDFQITASCAVVQAVGDETVDRLLDRASSTLQEAKRYGRNRTFMYERECPTPVVPPEMAVSGAGISI